MINDRFLLGLIVLGCVVIVLGMLALLFSGCAQEDAPQPIYITVDAPEPEPEPEPPAEPEPAPVMAEPAVKDVEDVEDVEDAEDAEDVEDAKEILLVLLFHTRLGDAFKAWSLDAQQLGNDFYIEAAEVLVTLQAEHGWTDEDVTLLSINASREQLLPYKDNLSLPYSRRRNNTRARMSTTRGVSHTWSRC